MTPTALIADDEPLLRERLKRQLASCWPELQICAMARHGLEALEMFEQQCPALCFLDVHMPGLSGIELAQRIGRRAHIVFVTAFDQYALQAFEQGALDYLVKPVEVERLSTTVARLRDRLAQLTPAPALDEALLARLLLQLQAQQGGALAPPPAPAVAIAPTAATPLRWIKASVGAITRLIPVQEIDYLRSDERYTVIAWRGDGHGPAEAVVRTPLKDLLAQLDPAQFQQIHRSVAVNLDAVRQAVRGANDTASLHLKHRPELLPVSRSYLHLFRAD
ncbi:LytTR family DNA-binding domain-containing protein [Paucibacter sp. APW11]|uniref:LytTR family DNA-binding domain-containing protein n=1 Tax=Roseateles aquae TaxID=3077235 RepID=A0ABU3PAY5_9BURK|nr:LytTR family DNA-binding domain-containing protein [Paucibacter sp. APW11]MDT8999741.1 LytTR family DNA-binding domain-containing protein [Paucibacter sp. APW11]